MIDLHTHTNASDGTDSPAELIEAALAAGLTTVAITDHDTTAGWGEAAAVATGRITLVRGLEISTSRDRHSIHILAYLVDPDDPDLTAELARSRQGRSNRMERMVAAMAADGIPISLADVKEQVAPGATLGRPHIADALIAGGIITHRDEAFASFLGENSKYYVSHYAPDPVEAIGLIRAAGGVAVLAHPFASRMAPLSDDLVEALAAAGLAGIEAHHRDHDARGASRAIELAQRLHLIVTGSSDYHGVGKLNRLGENTTEPAAYRALIEQASGVEVLSA